ncbi:hypothetical protein, partial [Pseudomonas syringae]|uniref:hypothetical protein n=1 Tax=Pseudomonas syringae TaxID=317 RepID=UPI00195A5826
ASELLLSFMGVILNCCMDIQWLSVSDLGSGVRRQDAGRVGFTTSCGAALIIAEHETQGVCD